MRKTFLIISLLFGFSILATAQDDAQYKAWMKSLPPSLGAIKNAPDNAAAAAEATKVAETFDKVAAFWKTKNAEDAVGFSETARDAAKAIASGSGDKAENLQKIQGACGGCHKVHREGKAPDFTIK
jgi:mono/diheme cytochrome c family protein